VSVERGEKKKRRKRTLKLKWPERNKDVNNNSTTPIQWLEVHNF